MSISVSPFSLALALVVLFPAVCQAENSSAYLLIETSNSEAAEKVESKLGGLQNCKGRSFRGFGYEVIAAVECSGPSDLVYAMTTDLSSVEGVTGITLMRMSR
jgi:hypothetical protein